VLDAIAATIIRFNLDSGSADATDDGRTGARRGSALEAFARSLCVLFLFLPFLFLFLFVVGGSARAFERSVW
jgi:hypothetical protein